MMAAALTGQCVRHPDQITVSVARVRPLINHSQGARFGEVRR